MSDVPVFMIANLEVHDADRYLSYEKGFFPILKRHAGEFFTFDDEIETFEGSAPPSGRMVLFRFPSQAAAKAWYEDPEYQELSKHRRAASKLNFLTLVHGLPPRKKS